MKTVKPKEFFSLIALNSGVNDIETVQRVFYGMIRTISRELREKHSVKLPDWGEFYLKTHKARRGWSVNSGNPVNIPAKVTVKFSPSEKVKQYFYQLGEQ